MIKRYQIGAAFVPAKHQAGMSLVEMIVTIAMYVILSGAVFLAISSLYQQNAYSLAQAEEVNNARRGMTEWNRDVKEMTTAEDGTYPLVVIEPHRLGYYSDTDQDDAVEYIEYELSSTTLYKRIYRPSGAPLSYDLSAPNDTEILSLFVQNINQSTSTFQYYDNSGQALRTGDPIVDVRYITASIIVNIDPLRNPGEFLLRSSLAPRNLKDNL